MRPTPGSDCQKQRKQSFCSGDSAWGIDGIFTILLGNSMRSIVACNAVYRPVGDSFPEGFLFRRSPKRRVNFRKCSESFIILNRHKKVMRRDLASNFNIL